MDRNPQTQKSIKADYVLRQFQVATALISVIPILALVYLISSVMGLQTFVISRTLVIFIVIATLLGMLVGRALILNVLQVIESVNAQLVRASEMKTAFLRNVAHESATPLATLRANLEALRDNLHGDLPKQAQRTVSSSLRQAERLLRMVSDLLDISQIEQGKLPMRHGRVNLAAVLQEAVETAGQSGEDAGGRVRIMAPAAPLWLERADRDRILQVLVNLLKNAEKYSPAGTPIVLAAFEKGGAAEVSVADQGDGVPPELREKIFEPFIRNTERKVDGIGLGLAISRHIAAEHGGRLWVEPNGANGSIFYFSIPKSIPPKNVHPGGVQ